MSQFDLVQGGEPSVSIGRSVFDRSSRHLTTFNAGKCVPIYLDEVLPGDTVKMDLSLLVRMTTSIAPTMDNAYLDYQFFFVPNRLLWNHWKEFMGENNESAWAPTTVYRVPGFSLTEDIFFSEGGVVDHFGIDPHYTADSVLSISALPFRAYRLIWNEWYRKQAVQPPVLIDFGDVAGDLHDYDELLPCAKYDDYFTSCLPSPQRGEAVLMPLGMIPVITGDIHGVPSGRDGRMTFTVDGASALSTDRLVGITGTPSRTTGALFATEAGTAGTTSPIEGVYISPNNLYADGSNANAATINALRMAFQLQKMLEKDGLYGGRYVEILRSHFGVVSPDGVQQRPQHLGGAHLPIQMAQVIQASASAEGSSALGTTAGLSKTMDNRFVFEKSFTEHGWIIGIACARTDHTYQDRLDRMFSRFDRYDYYDPLFANIGEQPVYKRELKMNTSTAAGGPNAVFGYQEAWADYRQKMDIVSGAFRHDAGEGTLDYWHYADWFSDGPTLSAEFIEETPNNIDRTLAVSHDLASQFLGDFYFKVYHTRPMPVFSVPGFADHH